MGKFQDFMSKEQLDIIAELEAKYNINFNYIEGTEYYEAVLSDIIPIGLREELTDRRLRIYPANMKTDAVASDGFEVSVDMQLYQYINFKMFGIDVISHIFQAIKNEIELRRQSPSTYEN